MALIKWIVVAVAGAVFALNWLLSMLVLILL